MRVAPVAASIRLVSEAVGTTPCKVFSREPKAPAPSHRAYGLVHDFANEWTSASALRARLTADAMLFGHGYARAIVVGGEVQELHRLDPRTVRQLCHDLTGEPLYRVELRSGGTVDYPFNEIIHVADGDDGLATISRAREAIALAELLERHTIKLFGNGTQPPSIVTFKTKMPAQAIENFRAAFVSAMRANTGEPLFIDGADGAEFQTVTPSAQASELSIQRRNQVIEIARFFNVPPTMLFDLERGTWSNVEQLHLQFRQFTIQPWLAKWADAYGRVLLKPEERAEHYIEFLADDLASADLAAQATAFGQYRSMGAMTANEVRAIRNLPALPGGDTLANPYTSSPEKAAA